MTNAYLCIVANLEGATIDLTSIRPMVFEEASTTKDGMTRQTEMMESSFQLLEHSTLNHQALHLNANYFGKAIFPRHLLPFRDGLNRPAGVSSDRPRPLEPHFFEGSPEIDRCGIAFPRSGLAGAKLESRVVRYAPWCVVEWIVGLPGHLHVSVPAARRREQ
jgi:hypothetical protein